jgi:Spx/MgsR family transcriptional regulator
MDSDDPLVIVYGISNCDSVKKAQAWLNRQGISFEFRDFKKWPPALNQVSRWWDVTEGTGLVNRKSTTWKSLSVDEQAATHLPEKAKMLLVKYPTLIKRPVVEYSGKVVVGFDEEKYAAVFES